MRIAVISDTHVPDKFETLSKRLVESIVGVDMILHCGDIVEPYVLYELSQIAPVKAVAGNHDIKSFGKELLRKRVLEMENYRIGMIHGDEFEDTHITRNDLMNILRKSVVEPFIYEEPLDVIVFGHCHQPIFESICINFYSNKQTKIKTKKSVVLFNPGMPIRNRHLSSIGFITLNEKSFNVEIKIFN